MHNTAARGHFRLNVEHDPRACFEVDEPFKVFDYGRFECDSGLAYRSAVAYGRIHIVEDRAEKIRFFDGLLAKYGTVYALRVERITGKHCPLPPSPSSGRHRIARRHRTRHHRPSVRFCLSQLA